MFWLKLMLHSLWARRFTVILTIFSISISVMLLLGVEKIRNQVRTSFMQTISGTDLIVGARSGPLQLLLYSVFRMGDATNNIDWQSYQHIKKHPAVKWAIPISLGDSHRGFRVMGTSTGYFKHYRYALDKPLELKQGTPFSDLYDAVIGADVAGALKYEIGQRITLSHGSANISFVEHDDKPFQVVGILKKTGTPVDRTVHVSLEAIEAIHIGWEQGVPPGQGISAEQTRAKNLQPKSITAFMLGLKSKIATFRLQRSINEYRPEPLLAILPGVVLQQLWSLMNFVEKTLFIISACVVLAGLLGLLIGLLTVLNERRREMAIFRSVGARPWQVFGMLISESAIVAFVGCALGALMLYVVLFLARPALEAVLGLSVVLGMPSLFEYMILALIMFLALIVACVPAWRTYRQMLSDGLMVR